jgi:hypothetical protein
VLALFVPLFLFVQFHVVGQLFLTELLLIILLPPLLLQRVANRRKTISRSFLVLGVLWFYSQVLTDLYRGTSFHDYARGWSNIAFTLIEYGSLFLLIAGNRRRYVLFAAGLAGGLLLTVLLNPSGYAIGDPWKFGYGFPVTLGIVLLACARRFREVLFLPALMLGGAGWLNLKFGFRSLGGVCILSALYLSLMQIRAQRAPGSVRLGARRTLLLGMASMVIGLALITSYGNAAKDGFLGQTAAKKYQQQSTGRFGVLLAGRPEIFGASAAIADSPLIGHGSWARDPRYTYYMLAQLRRLGYVALPPPPDTFDLIPSHSHISGAWVQAGVFGAIFWLFLLALALSVLAGLYRARIQLAPLIVFLAILFVWNDLFSPYAALARLIDVFTVVMLLAVRAELRAAEPSRELADGAMMTSTVGSSGDRLRTVEGHARFQGQWSR